MYPFDKNYQNYQAQIEGLETGSEQVAHARCYTDGSTSKIQNWRFYSFVMRNHDKMELISSKTSASNFLNFHQI